MWWISSNPTCTFNSSDDHVPQLENGAYNVTPPLDNMEMMCIDSARRTNAASSTADTTPHGYDPRVRPPTKKLTARQLFYIMAAQAIPAIIIGAGINFAIGYALYATPRPPPGPPPEGSVPPFLFHLPASLIADAAMTTIFQSIFTWFPLVYFVNRHLSSGVVAPHAFLGREPADRFVRWFMMLDHYNSERTSWVCCCAGRDKIARWAAFAFAGVGRAMLVAVAGYTILIAPAIIIMQLVGTPFQGDWVFLGRWDGPLFKLVWGAALALLIAPALTWMWMVRAGWIVGRHDPPSPG